MVDDPRVLKLCNEAVRTTAALFAQAYYAARQLRDAYQSGLIASLLPDDPSYQNLIADGAPGDGRNPITAGGLAEFIANMDGIIQQLETTQTPSGMTLIQAVLYVSHKLHVNA